MNRDEMHRDQVELAARLLGIPAAVATENSRTVPEDDALYFWEPGRGGGSLLVSSDGTVLFATSAVTYDAHVGAFRAGRRTDPATFTSRR